MTFLTSSGIPEALASTSALNIPMVVFWVSFAMIFVGLILLYTAPYEVMWIGPVVTAIALLSLIISTMVGVQPRTYPEIHEAVEQNILDNVDATSVELSNYDLRTMHEGYHDEVHHPTTVTVELYFEDENAFMSVDMSYNAKHDLMMPVQEYDGEIEDVIITGSDLEHALISDQEED